VHKNIFGQKVAMNEFARFRFRYEKSFKRKKICGVLIIPAAGKQLVLNHVLKVIRQITILIL